MPTFSCVVRDARGAVKEERREATSQEAALQELREAGLYVLSVKPEHRITEAIKRLYRNRRVSKADIAFSERRLAMMLRNGIDLATALESMARQTTNDRLRSAFQDIHAGIMAGDSLSECLSRAPGMFSLTAVGLVKAGEESGKLGECLDEVARLNIRDLETRSRIISAFMYPVIVLLIATGIILFFLLVVLPRFMTVFESFGAKIPLPTRILLGVHAFLINTWPLLLLGGGVGGFLLYRYWKTETGRIRIDNLKLRIPILGRLALLSGLSRIARTFGSLLRSGLPVDHALDIVGNVTENAQLRAVLRNAQTAVVRGATLHEALSSSDLIPEMLLQMVNSGEMSGSLDSMLEEIGEFYEIESSIAIRNLTTALEPVMLVGMAVVVGSMALAVLLPLFRMTQALK